MYKVEWSDLSLDRVEEICEYIELDSISNSIKFSKEIFSKEVLLRNNPYLGIMVPEYNIEEFRQIFIGNYRLAYKIIGKTILIVTIRHCKQEELF